MLTRYNYLLLKIENEKIICKFAGLMNPLTKVVTGCQRMTKDTIFVVFSYKNYVLLNILKM